MNPNECVLPAELWHRDHVAERLRPEHEREAALLGLDGADALRLSFDRAAVCYALLVDGEPLFLSGASEPDLLGGAALAWLAGTVSMDAHPFPVLRAARWILPQLHGRSGAKRIENYIPADYRKALKFARWIGCEYGYSVMRAGVEHIHVYHDLGDEIA